MAKKTKTKKVTAKKAAVKKATPKKKVVKKATPKKKVAAKKKSTTKKAVAKKATPKKAVAKKKTTAKKATPKKAAPKKKTVAKKKAAPKKKTTTKKVVKKAAPKKKVVKKVPPKKKVVKKAAPKKKVAAKKATTKKKTTPKKATPKKTVKKAAPKKKVVAKKKAAAKKPATKPAPKKEVVKQEKKTKRRRSAPVKQQVEKKPVVEVSKEEIKAFEPKINLPRTPERKPGTKRKAMKQDDRARYSDEELDEFKELITDKLDEAKSYLDSLQGSLSNRDNNGTDDTAITFKMMEDGSETLTREEVAQLAARQEKFITHLKNALIRIQNKTYGICRVTGKLIPKERLKAVPHATLSIEAKEGKVG